MAESDEEQNKENSVSANKAPDGTSTSPEEVSLSPANSDSDMVMDNEKENSAQELEENLDLAMENDNWAGSPASFFSPDEENEGLDSVNKWD